MMQGIYPALKFSQTLKRVNSILHAFIFSWFYLYIQVVFPKIHFLTLNLEQQWIQNKWVDISMPKEFEWTTFSTPLQVQTMCLLVSMLGRFDSFHGRRSASYRRQWPLELETNTLMPESMQKILTKYWMCANYENFTTYTFILIIIIHILTTTSDNLSSQEA